MSLFKTCDKIYFNPDFDFNETLRKCLIGNEDRFNAFDIEMEFDDSSELGFDFICTSEGEIVFSFNIKPKKAIELYHALKKEIEQLKTLNDLKFILDGDL